MFRAVPLSIIRSFSLYTQQWYMSYGFADSLGAGSGRNWFRPDRKWFRPDPFSRGREINAHARAHTQTHRHTHTHTHTHTIALYLLHEIIWQVSRNYFKSDFYKVNYNYRDSETSSLSTTITIPFSIPLTREKWNTTTKVNLQSVLPHELDIQLYNNI